MSVMTSDGQIKIVDLDENKVIYSQKKHNLPVTSSVFLANNNYILTGSADYTYNFI